MIGNFTFLSESQLLGQLEPSWNLFLPSTFKITIIFEWSDFHESYNSTVGFTFIKILSMYYDDVI